MPLPTIPATVPRWAQTAAGAQAANIVTPPSGQLDSGWNTNQIPPSGWFNWFQNLTYQWILWLQSITQQTLTWTGEQVFTAGTSHKYMHTAQGILAGRGNLAQLASYLAPTVPTAATAVAGATTSLDSNATDTAGTLGVNFVTSTPLAAGSDTIIAHLHTGNNLLPEFAQVSILTMVSSQLPSFCFYGLPSASGGNGIDVHMVNTTAGSISVASQVFVQYLMIF